MKWFEPDKIHCNGKVCITTFSEVFKNKLWWLIFGKTLHYAASILPKMIRK